ncbi:MAG: orotidine-5'-phosphate decarboxylase [Gammaproteobacteria bacterium]|nr:orotidine-5'-phosphate decarboxylase [Gammaproteobacteria bacterium]
MSLDKTSDFYIPPNQRLIVALDVPNIYEAKSLVDKLGSTVEFYKIGLELATTRDYFDLLNWLTNQGKSVFADLKLYDVPATVSAAVRQLRNSGATFLTVHGDKSIMEAAASEKGDLQILAVTVLTSMDNEDLKQMGIGLDVEDLVLERAKLAISSGCDGVIASGLEVQTLRQTLGNEATIVTPGIRPADSSVIDDQKRIVTPKTAFEDGTNYIVVGRPIRNAIDPKSMAETIQAEIAAAI